MLIICKNAKREPKLSHVGRGGLTCAFVPEAGQVPVSVVGGPDLPAELLVLPGEFQDVVRIRRPCAPSMFQLAGTPLLFFLLNRCDDGQEDHHTVRERDEEEHQGDEDEKDQVHEYLRAGR